MSKFITNYNIIWTINLT